MTRSAEGVTITLREKVARAISRQRLGPGGWVPFDEQRAFGWQQRALMRADAVLFALGLNEDGPNVLTPKQEALPEKEPPAMTTDLPGLIARLRGAEGPDRELDDLIYSALVFRDKTGTFVSCSVVTAPHYTASIDTALDLVSRMLPGWYGDINVVSPSSQGGKFGARLYPPSLLEEENSVWESYSTVAATPPLAILIVLLRALRFKDASHD